MSTKEQWKTVSKNSTRVITKKNGSSTSSTASTIRKYRAKLIIGQDNPAYKTQIANVQNAGTALSGDFIEHEISSWACGAKYAGSMEGYPPLGNVSIIHGGAYANVNLLQKSEINFDVPFWGDLPSMVSADNRAKSAIIREIRKAQTTFQGGVFLGELAELVRMIKSPAKALRQGVSSYLTRMKKVRRQVKQMRTRRQRRSAMADTWLEYSFGWSPFINDIEDAKELIANRANRLETKKVSAFGEDKRSGGEINLGNAGTSLPTYKVSAQRVITARVRYYGVVAAGTSSPFSMRRVGLDLSNFAPTVWELIPYSFLIDYFVNIGEIINSLSLSQSGTRWLMRVEETEYSFKTSWTNVDFSPTTWGNSHYKPGSYGGRRVLFNRGQQLGPLTIQLQFKVPGAGLKWLNIGALARNHKSLLPFF